MESVARFWMEGGWWMYPILLLGLGAVVVSALQIGVGNRVFQITAVVVALTPAALGMVGWLHGRSVVDTVIPMAAPEDRETLRTVGYAEASRPLQLGGGFTVVCLPLLGIGLARKRD